MARKIEAPVVIPAAGFPPKIIEEFFGQASTQESRISIARMTSPAGWSEPGQTPQFDEFTLVLRGLMQVETPTGTFRIAAGQAIQCSAGEWVRYSTPEKEGAEYIAICLPAFSTESVHRDA